MSDPNEIMRLVLHAAGRLDEEEPQQLVQLECINTTQDRVLRAHALSLTAAISCASAVLRMVAACMSTEDRASTPEGRTEQ